MSNLTSTKELKRTLGFWDLMGASVGQIIGAGIMSLTGVAIGMTGRSAPLAFILSAAMVLISWYPLTLINTTARFRGGQYSIIGSLLGEKYTGAYTIIFILTNISLSMYCLSFADYALPFLPFVPRKLLAIGILIILYGLNFLGIDKFAKFQNVIVVSLVVALTTFTVYGFGKIDANYMDPASFMTGGWLGLLRATAQLTFATGGAQVIANLSGEAKNPTRDIPRVMVTSTLAVAVLYGFMATVAAGVFPVAHVANEPLTHVAKEILPKQLYVFFIVGGAWAALISTLNSQLASATKPLMQAANDGWLPAKLATLHRNYKTPMYLLTIFFFVGLLPIVFNLNISIISKIVTTVQSVTNSMIALCLLSVAKKLPKQWENSPLHIKEGAVKALVTAAVMIFILQAILLGTSLSLPLLIGNGCVVIFAFTYANIRYNSGKIKCDISYEIEDAKEEEKSEE
ncbi:APC family permease [Fusobacterium varium]|uniref:APC family permease n=1 Tax=Fusobacterium varium TaxID=856 RepID=UPI000BBABB11|nr:APC family permease [uncultured Fusobacterium sp.]BBA50356.1 putative amino acid permease [Fusobacterium varium]